MNASKEPFDTDAKDELGKRLDELNKRHGRDVEEQDKSPGARGSGYAGMAAAMRLSTEFVSAILVGFIIGYGIDWLVGTTPWMMIVFLFIGFIAGVKNILRAAGELSGS